MPKKPILRDIAVTRRDRFLGAVKAVVQRSVLVAEIEAYYTKGEGCGRPPIALQGMLRTSIANNTSACPTR